MPYLDRSDARIYYESHGQGPAILLTHGYSASCRMWDGQIEFFKDRFQVLVWDMRGHGQSDSPDDSSAYSEAATVADMAAILDAGGIERAVVGGLSLGGYMSLAFNLVHAGRAKALMAIDTGPGYRSDEARKGWNDYAEGFAQRFEAKGVEALSKSAEVRASEHRGVQGLIAAARGMLTQEDSRVIDSLPSIDKPTLVLVGADDKPFLTASDYMAAKIPGATRVVIEGAGHAANIDRPAEFNQAVASFLDGLPSVS